MRGFPPPRRPARRGVSFIEILATVVVMALVLVPFMSYFSMGTRNAGSMLGRTVGLDLAYQAMDRLSVQPVSRLEVYSGISGDAEDLLSRDPILRVDSLSPGYRKMFDDYQYKRHVTFQKSPSPTSCLGTLRVRVTWTLPSQNRPGEVSISRVIIDQACFQKARSGLL